MTCKAVVLLSGGLDSATTLAAVQAQGFEAYALSFEYGQRHRSELDAAKRLAQAFAVRAHRVVRLDTQLFEGSALVGEVQTLPTEPTVGIPCTYVPARNTIMLSMALAWAEVLEAEAIAIGVNAVDYSNYPDCRPDYIAAFQTVANLATKSAIEGRLMTILTPLLHFSKAQIIAYGHQLGVPFLLTVSCYQADSEGLACGACHSCQIRRAGFLAAGCHDMTRYQTPET